VKRLAVLLAATGLLATAIGTGTASALDDAHLQVVPGGVKKATATWDDWTVTEPAAVFDAYWVVADDDSGFTAFTADRGRFVDKNASRSVLFDDLNAGTTYSFAVYAVDYTPTGVDVVPPTDGLTGSPISAATAHGSTLTINQDHTTVLTGKPVSIYGSLVDDGNAPMPTTDIVVKRDPFPYGDPVNETATTDANGKWSKSYNPTVSTRYSATYEPASGVGGWTRTITVDVRKKITIQVQPSTTVSAGTVVKFVGQVNADPTLVAGLPICWQRFDTAWGGGACAPIADDGSYLLKFPPGANADGKYRVWSGMGPAYADSWTKTKTLTVN
jgi:hypothetical protein